MTINTAGVALGLAGVMLAACGGDRDATHLRRLAPVTARVERVVVAALPQQLELFGTVEADKTAALSSRVMATVTGVHVVAGDRVRKGQALIEIDPDTARGQEAQARGALAQAKAALALAERNHERFKGLAAKGAASELELDLARMQHEQALGAVMQARGAVDAASSVARESRVVAPFSGRIARRMVEVGDLAAPGRPLVMLESEGGRSLVLAVPESTIAASGLAVGAEIPVRIDSLPGREMVGTVVEMAPGADPVSHTVMTKIALATTEVATGSAGRAMVASSARKAVVVPVGALAKAGGIDLVVVRDADGRARTRAVTLGATNQAGLVEVLSGLADGESVVLGLLTIPADGTPVEVQS
jgi:RND family efflux transporter MFP subunit